MTHQNWAQVAKIVSTGGQWEARIGYYAAEDAMGKPSQFTCHDTLYADGKNAAIQAAERNYPGIKVETMFDHLTKPRSGPAFGFK